MSSFRRARELLSPKALTTAAVVPKQRRPKFDLRLKILDLNNVPYITGRSFVKWHLPHSAAAEHRGRTDKYPIKDHKVVYNYETLVPVRLVVDKNGMLQEAHIHFEVLHEVVSAGKPERIGLGWVKLNIAEYVEASEQEGEEGVTRRYLMQESKINSTLKICIHMRQTEGDRNFTPPPLKMATVFSGIAGIMAGDQGEADDAGHAPVVNPKAREAGDDLRELYRRTLAADWSCQPGEPSADKCIEDIFAGGDGWGDGQQQRHVAAAAEPATPPIGSAADRSGNASDDDARTLKESKQRNWSGFFGRRHAKKGSRHEEALLPEKDDDGHLAAMLNLQGAAAGVRDRGGFEHQAARMKREADGRTRPANELDEFEVREDLRCWKMLDVQ